MKVLIENHRFARMSKVLGNIILVGETGVGKSSIINMIAGTKLAPTCNGATACAFGHHSYNLPVHGRNFKFLDTAGLDEGDLERGTVERSVAIVKLYKLLTGLDGGINLLMFCMSGNSQRINNAVHQNWKIFSEILGKKQVPSVLVVTGLEQEDNMNEWWWNNRKLFEDQGIRPDDTACITTIRGIALQGGGHAYDEHYEESQAKIPNMILNRVLLRPWRVNKINWFYEVTRSFFFFFQWTKIREAKEIKEIVDACGMSMEETVRFREELAKL
jgi:GTPase SAR1 family protein